METRNKKRSKGESWSVNVATSIEPKVFEVLEEVAARNGLTKSHILRAFFLRGMAAYNRDGKLNEVTDSESHREQLFSANSSIPAIR